MKVKDVFWGTMKFVWLKLALGGAVTLAALLLFGLFTLLGSLIGGRTTILLPLIWAVVSFGLYRLAMRYVGYLVRASHIAVIAQAVTAGAIPEDQIKWGVETVKSRFGAANTFFVIDSLVSGAVRQLQRVVGKVTGFLDFIPGMGAVGSFLNRFIALAVGYIDDCCLGWAFLHKEQGAFQSSCEGVVIYFQNMKPLMKNAAKTTLIVVGLTLLAWVLPLILFLLIFKALGWSSLAAVLLSIMAALFIKSAFIDSYMLVEMMVAYMKVAPGTELSYDLYGKLSGMSSKFKRLFAKAKEEAAGAAPI